MDVLGQGIPESVGIELLPFHAIKRSVSDRTIRYRQFSVSAAPCSEHISFQSRDHHALSFAGLLGGDQLHVPVFEVQGKGGVADVAGELATSVVGLSGSVPPMLQEVDPHTERSQLAQSVQVMQRSGSGGPPPSWALATPDVASERATAMNAIPSFLITSFMRGSPCVEG